MDRRGRKIIKNRRTDRNTLACTARLLAAVSAPRNPFLPPDPELVVGPLPPAHVLLLNKFNVVAHHLLVVTQEFRSQV